MEQWQKEREKQLLDFMVYKSSMILNELINVIKVKNNNARRRNLNFFINLI